MAAPTNAASTVVLRGGMAVPIAALRLLWDLEQRGCTVRETADGFLFVGPRRAITPDDDAAIRAHRNALLALLRYTAPEVM